MAISWKSISGCTEFHNLLSLDPTLDIWSIFVKKEIQMPPFFTSGNDQALGWTNEVEHFMFLICNTPSSILGASTTEFVDLVDNVAQMCCKVK